MWRGDGKGKKVNTSARLWWLGAKKASCQLSRGAAVESAHHTTNASSTASNNWNAIICATGYCRHHLGCFFALIIPIVSNLYISIIFPIKLLPQSTYYQWSVPFSQYVSLQHTYQGLWWPTLLFVNLLLWFGGMPDYLLFKRMFSTGGHRQYIELQGDYWKGICAAPSKLCQFQSRHTLRKNINFIFAFEDALAPQEKTLLLTQWLMALREACLFKYG